MEHCKVLLLLLLTIFSRVHSLYPLPPGKGAPDNPHQNDSIQIGKPISEDELKQSDLPGSPGNHPPPPNGSKALKT